MRYFQFITVAILIGGSCYTSPSTAGGTARALTNAATHRIEASLVRQELTSEALRDLKTPVTRLPKSRIVWRYTKKQYAQEEQRAGIASNRHLTAQRTGSKPLSAYSAQRRYGLHLLPEVRETVLLPRGHPVRINKAWRGQPGVGEITSPQPLPRTAIIAVRSLKR